MLRKWLRCQVSIQSITKMKQRRNVIPRNTQHMLMQALQSKGVGCVWMVGFCWVWRFYLAPLYFMCTCYLLAPGSGSWMVTSCLYTTQHIQYVYKTMIRTWLRWQVSIQNITKMKQRRNVITRNTQHMLMQALQSKGVGFVWSRVLLGLTILPRPIVFHVCMLFTSPR